MKKKVTSIALCRILCGADACRCEYGTLRGWDDGAFGCTINGEDILAAIEKQQIQIDPVLLEQAERDVNRRLKEISKFREEHPEEYRVQEHPVLLFAADWLVKNPDFWNSTVYTGVELADAIKELVENPKLFEIAKKCFERQESV